MTYEVIQHNRVRTISDWNQRHSEPMAPVPVLIFGRCERCGCADAEDCPGLDDCPRSAPAVAPLMPRLRLEQWVAGALLAGVVLAGGLRLWLAAPAGVCG